MRYPAFIGGSGRAQSPLAGIERTVNFYLEQMPSPAAKNAVALFPTPGLTPFYRGTELTGRGRAILEYHDRLFVIVGNIFAELSPSGTVIRQQQIRADELPGMIVTNGEEGGQILFSSGGFGYIFDLDLETVTGVVLPMTMIGYLDGFFIRFDGLTGTMAISALDDGTSWDPLQSAQRSGAPDKWRAMAVNTGDIWLIGGESGEIWTNTGAYPFPFAPRGGITFEPGIIAPFSLRSVSGNMTWLSRGADGQGLVVQARGYSPEPISSTALAYAISTYARIDDATSYVYQDQGHVFYVLNFPTAKRSWMYDQTMGIWTELGRWDDQASDYTGWGVSHHAFAFGKHLVAGEGQAGVYEMSTTLFSDITGNPIRRQRTAPGISLERKLITYDRVELYCDNGIGLPAGLGADPQALMRMSRDGGRTWDAGRWRSAGKQGDFLKALIWNRNGSSRDAVFEWSFSDPVPWRIVDAFMTIRQGTS